MCRFILFVFLFLLVACSSSPQKAYILTPDGPAPRGGGGVSIGIGPIRLADYLMRPEIPVATGVNQLEYAYDSLWAGSLEKQLTGTIAVNVGRRLKTGTLYHYPWSQTSNVRYQVSLDVRTFHTTTDGRAILDTGWRVYDLQMKKIVSARSSYLVEEFSGEGFSPATSAQSRLVSRLSAEIARTIR